MNETTNGTGSSLLYDTCYDASHGSDASTLQCIAATFEERRREIESSHFNQSTLTNWMLVLCGALVFFMQAGFAMVCAGSVRKKNVVNTMLKNLLDACAAAIAFYTVGYGLAYGGNDTLTGTTFVGNSGFFGHGVEDFGFWFFQYAFSAATVTIVAGALAERCKMTAYFSYSLLLTGIVYPIVAHAVWSNSGLLSPTNEDPVGGIGYIDAAGSGAIHLCGGLTALIATSILGPRQGRFHDDEGLLLDEPKPIKGHSMALQLLGTLILWFGWYGFNGGSALLLGDFVDTGVVATRATVNTTMASAAGALTALAAWALTTGQKGFLSWDLPTAMNGALSGLVSITAGAFTLDYWSSIVTGALAGILYIKSSTWLEHWRVDDAVNAVPVHMFCGGWGVIAVGLFSNPSHVEDAFGVEGKGGLFFEFGSNAGTFDMILLRNQIFGLIFICGWTIVTTLPFFYFLDYMKWFRVEKIVELGGLDAHFHGEDRDLVGQADLLRALDISRTARKPVTGLQPEPTPNRPQIVSFS